MQYSVTSTGQAHEFNEGEGGAAFQPILNNLNGEEEVVHKCNGTVLSH